MGGIFYAVHRRRRSVCSRRNRDHGSFDNNEGEVVSELTAAVKNNVEAVSPSGLDAAVRLFKDLSHATAAKEVIEYYSQRQESREFWDLAEHGFGDEVSDPDVRRMFDEKHAALTDERDPVQSLWDIGPDGWGHEAFERVARITGNEFYDIFKRLRGKELSKAIQGALRFRRISNADDTMKGIVSAAEAALHRIAAESAINERRVRMKYGVLLPPGGVPKPKAPRRKPPGITVRLR